MSQSRGPEPHIVARKLSSAGSRSSLSAPTDVNSLKTHHREQQHAQGKGRPVTEGDDSVHGRPRSTASMNQALPRAKSGLKPMKCAFQ